ncbi:MAG: fatty-acid oxidation protein subunit alpha [Moorea sp. SIOASIH]|uniref:element excision factor XisH family protein n=1 Tax=Moorena sp. SIOASIH TaxID=2607817 RepID=UPI0013BDE793|nr:element excision factor XisH family protein [Moorena sp. SIOASIH]NEO42318.1 fatty-acid oxidation protein subunit alpha [Moorena sp. SIOASIH]
MPVRDYYHDIVRNALQKDGWTITHDPYRLKLTRKKNLYIDLGAERLMAAEKGVHKIAVEIKSFRSASEMKDLEEAVGQFVLYEHLLARYEPERKLYLAVPEDVRASVFEEEAGQVLIEDKIIRIFTFDVNQEEVITWIP